MRYPLFLATAAVAAALLAAGCGSSDSSTTAASSPPADTQESATTSSTSSIASSTAGAAVLATKHDKLGTVLAAGEKHLTVYLFEADKGASSACSGECAKVWPPVSSTADPKATGAARSADLGTLTRADGSTQVTYKGHPLYYYVKDKDAEDSYGQGLDSFGAGWYVLSPSGEKLEGGGTS